MVPLLLSDKYSSGGQCLGLLLQHKREAPDLGSGYGREPSLILSLLFLLSLASVLNVPLSVSLTPLHMCIRVMLVTVTVFPLSRTFLPPYLAPFPYELNIPSDLQGVSPKNPFLDHQIKLCVKVKLGDFYLLGFESPQECSPPNQLAVLCGINFRGSRSIEGEREVRRP